MSGISTLQQTALIVGGSFVFAKALQGIWNHHIIKKTSIAISMTGSVLSVTALAISLFQMMKFYIFHASHVSLYEKARIIQQFSDWMKESAVLGTISLTALALI